MARTTIDIDASVLREVERRKTKGTSLGQLVSELLAQALAAGERPEPPALDWPSHDLRPLVDIDDKEAVRRALDAS